MRDVAGTFATEYVRPHGHVPLDFQHFGAGQAVVQLYGDLHAEGVLVQREVHHEELHRLRWTTGLFEVS